MLCLEGLGQYNKGYNMGVCQKDEMPKIQYLIDTMNTKDMDLIELGDQLYIEWKGHEVDTNIKIRDMIKDKFKSYRTLDLHPVDGVEIFDLSVASKEENCADVITNFGTIEHIEPEQGQYNCWMNIHNFLRINGIVLHSVPLVKLFSQNHCRYFFDFDFFKVFERYGYKILELEVNYNNAVFCKMIKVENKSFMSYDEFMSIVKFKNTDCNLITPSNNPKHIVW